MKVTVYISPTRGTSPPQAAASGACWAAVSVAVMTATAQGHSSSVPRPQGVSVYGLKPMHVHDYNLPLYLSHSLELDAVLCLSGMTKCVPAVSDRLVYGDLYLSPK